MCRTLRIDTLGFDTATGVQGVARPIYDSVRQKVYFAWSSATHTSVSIQHNYQVFFRALDVAAETWDSAPVAVSIENPDVGLGIGTCDAVGMLRIPSTGELVIFYGDIISCYYHTSTDNGVTWSSPRGQVSLALSFQQLLSANDSSNDDLYCWTQQTAGGAGQNDVYLFKRAAGSAVWAAKGLFDDGAANEGIDHGARSSAPRTAVFKGDGQIGFAVFSRLQSNNDIKLRCYYTTNDWTTVSTVDIKSWPNSGGAPSQTATYPIVLRGVLNTNRCYVMWVESTPSPAPFFAYTDDFGATWTIVGHPTDFNGYDWDEAYDRAFMLDYADKFYSSVFTVNADGGTSGHNFHTFLRNSTLALTGWATSHCDVEPLHESGSTCGDMIYALLDDNTTKVFRVFNRTYAADPIPDGHTEYNVLIEDDFVPPPHEGPTCIVTPLSDYIVLPSGSVMMCGPIAPSGITYTWAWTGPSGFTASTRCITVSVAGTYNLTVTDELGQVASCSGVAIAIPALPESSEAGSSMPFHRGVIVTEPSGHPSGIQSIRTAGF